jgi:malonyl-CoA/methylmalonyl-CoA synthetase
MHLMNLFDLSLKGKKNKVGLVYNEKHYSFGEIDARSNQMAALLQAKGFLPGDRLAVYLENCIELIDLYLAAIKTGIIFVPINILYKERELSHILTDAAPKALVANGPVPGGFDAWQLSTLNEELNNYSTDLISSVVSTGDTAAAIVYTSGTTGASKGAILTHNNFISNGINIVTCWQITEQDSFLLALPLFHVHALANGLHAWLISGCCMKLLVRFEHQHAAQEFVSFKPTLFFGVPTVYIRLLDQHNSIAKEIGANIRLFVCGSAPLPAHIMEAFAAKYGHVILERYGMTETLMNISNPYCGERRAGTVGFPLPGISAKIILPDGSLAKVDEEGEVYVKGPNVFAGYWNRAQATADAFVDGYFKTGDMGLVSADGYFTLKGRKSDLIISGGFNIYPREIEEFLLEQPGVKEAAVVGVPHDTRGEVPAAYIVSDTELDLEELEELCKQSFASFKLPRTFTKVDALPRTALGKVQKHLLPKP